MGTAEQRQTARGATLTRTSEREMHIERVFDAPRERVWRALTEPELLAQWWGRGHPLDVETWELRAGGHWRFVEHAGGESHGFEGRFREVTPTTRIVQSFEWDGMPARASVQTMTLVDLGDGRTRLLTDVQFMTREDLEGMFAGGAEVGMNQSYAALDRVLAGLR